MLHQWVCVSFYGRDDYPTPDEILCSFWKCGPIEHIISHETFKDHLFVKFGNRQAAEQCYEQRLRIFKDRGYIAELKDKDNEDQGQRGGRDDPNLPSIMDLNDDCILHLLSYLQEEDAVKFISVRIRRLCKLLWRKQRRFTVGRRYKPCLDRLYHSGDYATHLSLHEIRPDAYDLTFSICGNLKYLGLFNITFESEYERIDLQKVKNVSSITELDLHQVKENDLSVMFRDNYLKLEKLCIRYDNISYSEIPTMSSLTTIMILGTEIDIGRFLEYLPQTKVLGCTLGATSHPIPDNNTLQELFVLISENRKSDLLKIRRSCPQLRHLRVEGDNFLEYGVRQFLPLDGLHLSDMKIRKRDLIEISYLANELKIFFLFDCDIDDYDEYDDDSEPEQEPDDDAYAKVLSKFKKLEMTSWENDSHGNIDFFLTNRLANTPLRIITGDTISPEQKLLSPSCEWVPNFESIFDPFSIYKNLDDDECRDDSSADDNGANNYDDFW